MTPDQHPIRGRVLLWKLGGVIPWWRWVVIDTRLPHRGCVIESGERTTLPAAYDRCAAAVAQAREDEAT